MKDSSLLNTSSDSGFVSTFNKKKSRSYRLRCENCGYECETHILHVRCPNCGTSLREY